MRLTFSQRASAKKPEFCGIFIIEGVCVQRGSTILLESFLDSGIWNLESGLYNNVPLHVTYTRKKVRINLNTQTNNKGIGICACVLCITIVNLLL